MGQNIKRILQQLLPLIFSGISKVAQRFKAFFYSLLVLVIIGLLGNALINNAPEIKRLDYVEIKPLAQGVTLGWQELGQLSGSHSAEKEHLRIRYGGHGDETEAGWSLQNISADRRVDSLTDKTKTRYLRRYALKKGDVLHFNTFTLNVKQANGEQLVLHNSVTKETAVWTGTALEVNDKSGYHACEHNNALRRGVGAISDWFSWMIRNSRPQEALRLFSLGGQVHCTGRWNQAGLAPDSLRFYWHKGQFWLGLGSDPARVVVEHNGKRQELKGMSLAVDSAEEGKVRRLILGRTYYQLAATDKLMTLKPVLNQQVFFATDKSEQALQALNEEEQKFAAKQAAKEKEQLRDMQARGVNPVYHSHQWIGESLDVAPFRALSLLLLLVLAISSLVFSVLVARSSHTLTGKGRFMITFTLSSVSLFFSWVAIAWKGDLSMVLPWLWLIALWTSFILFIHGRLRGTAGSIWTLTLALIGFGALTLSQLAAGADNTRWLHYATNYIFWVSQISVLIALLALIPLTVLDGLWLMLVRNNNRFMRFIKGGLLGLVVFFLLAQFAVGSEQGIWGVQPVEIAKLVIIFIVGHAMWHLYSLRTIHSSYYRDNPLARIMLFLWVLFAFVIISLLISVGVHDYSPTLIVLALMAAYLWRVIPHPVRTNRQQHTINWSLRSALVIVPIVTVVAAGIWFFNHPPNYESQIPQAERLRIWANPDLFPEAASQLLNSLHRIGGGGWFGSSWFGMNGLSMQVPAVQDDFIAAFLLNRFGGLMGLLLVIIQLLWIATLFRLSQRLTQKHNQHQLYAAHSILGNILYGLVWVHLLHWVISWSNVLGLLPIMGQPMTWLSAGNSHLLAIASVTLVLGLVGSWVVADER